MAVGDSKKLTKKTPAKPSPGGAKSVYQYVHAGKGSKGNARKNRELSQECYHSYIHKVLKQIKPEMGISSKAINQVNGLLVYQMNKLIDLSANVARTGKKSTLASRHVQAATNVLLPFDLATHAVTEGTKAVTRFAAA